MTTANSTPPGVHLNHLAGEKSPYLLQHAHNPVDWHPWGHMALARARAEQKPIFLSIGYSTCHWCHVMERESFENEAVAACLNARFVSIKVDREERPDLDHIYMSAVQAMTGAGGWPLNVFLTPELQPFFGGTYFPPRAGLGRPGFLQLLERINDAWQHRRDDLLRSATELGRHLEHLNDRPAPAGPLLTPVLLRDAADQFKAEYDPRHGGFGGAPKFPRPSQPAFLLAYGVRVGDEEAVRMVLHTCDAMAAGGIHDHLGGGFARYSVDAGWRVPHFEKMLYDNAQLACLYLDTCLAGGGPRHAEVVRGILRYVLRDLTDSAGGFYSAEDADSEGKEGKFYCWTRAEIESLLTPDESAVATRYFGVTEQGNFVDHSDPDPLPGQNVLSLANPHLSEAERALLASASAKLFAARSKRVRPLLDDKVLVSWNGLMLGALARAAVVLDDASYRTAAEKNLAFVQTRLWDAATATLHHRWREGARDSAQLLDDYAFLLDGVIALYETTLEPAHLEFATALADALARKFYDDQAGGFWQTPADAPHLILRAKPDYDGAEPSGNSVAILALLKLAAVTGRPEYRERAERGLRHFAPRLQQVPQAVPHLLQALDFWLEPPRRVVIAGQPGDSATRALLRAAHSVYQPHKVVLGTLGAVEPFARTLPADDGRPTAYVCTGTDCRPPTREPETVRQHLCFPPNHRS